MFENVELKEICDYKNGYAFYKEGYSEKGRLVIDLFNISEEGRLQFSEKDKYISEELWQKKSDFILSKGDLIMAMTDMSSSLKILGRTAIIDHSNKYILNQRIFRLKINKEIVDLNYLHRITNTSIFLKPLHRFAKGSNQKYVNTKEILSAKIPLPPLPTQKKIASILDEADTLRQLNKQLITKYDALTQSLFLEMFGDPVANPMGWEKVNFGNYITVLTDYHSNGSYKSLSEHVTLKDDQDYALMVRTTDLEKNNFIDGVKYIDEHAYNHLKKSQVFGGEIIINKIGSAGKVYRMPKLDKPVSLGMNAFLLRFNESINQVFLYFQLISKYGEREIQKRVKGAVTKTIRKDAVREIPIVSPPINLQNQFAERVAVIEQQKAQAQQSLQKSEDLFNSLLQKAFKGELVK